MSNGWINCLLGDVLTLKRGYDLPHRDRVEGNVPIYSSSGVSGNHNVAKVPGPGVVTGRYGTLGEVFYVDGPYWPLNTSLYVQDFKGNDPRFISYLLRTMGFERHNVAGAVPGVNRNALHMLPVQIPPLETQRQIAGILSAYDDLIENNTRRIRILEEMAQSLYREWFVHFRYPGHEHVPLVESSAGPIPEGWEVVPFIDIADVLSGGTPKTTVPGYWDGNIPFFAPRDAPDTFYATLTSKHITEAGLAKCNSKLYPKDTVFVTARGTVGKVVLAAVPMAMNQSCYALRGREGINQTFLFMVTQANIDYLKQNTGGATFDTIVVDTFRRMHVARPGYTLICQFSDMVTPLLDLTLNLTNQVTVLRNTRDSLMPKLMSP